MTEATDVPTRRLSVDFYFDPACPWTWITARWVVEVASQRPVDVSWKLFSLRHRNRDNPAYDRMRDSLNAQHRGMRVLEATRLREGNDAVGRLYAALGTRIHHDGDEALVGLADAVRDADLDASLLAAADDPALDDAIIASTEAALGIVGEDVGIPIIRIDGALSTFFGPVLSPAPTGAQALRLWDAFVAFTSIEGVYELKRSRGVDPQFGRRPR